MVARFARAALASAAGGAWSGILLPLPWAIAAATSIGLALGLALVAIRRRHADACRRLGTWGR